MMWSSIVLSFHHCVLWRDDDGCWLEYVWDNLNGDIMIRVGNPMTAMRTPYNWTYS